MLRNTFVEVVELGYHKESGREVVSVDVAWANRGRQRMEDDGLTIRGRSCPHRRGH
jgi:hypothetical protein